MSMIELSDQEIQRRASAEKLRELGIDPFQQPYILLIIYQRPLKPIMKKVKRW